MSLLKLFVPDELPITTISRQKLPANWHQYPAPSPLADIGTKWINQRETVGLKVPSVLVPDEWNILLNPGSKNYSKIAIQSVESLQLDSRF